MKYYLVNTWTKDTLLAGDNRTVLDDMRYGDDAVVDEKTWVEEYEPYTMGSASCGG